MVSYRARTFMNSAIDLEMYPVLCILLSTFLRANVGVLLTFMQAISARHVLFLRHVSCLAQFNDRLFMLSKDCPNDPNAHAPYNCCATVRMVAPRQSVTRSRLNREMSH